MSLLDNMESNSSVKLVGLTAARLKEIALDEKITPTGFKRLDFKFEYRYEGNTYNSKFSLWIKDQYDVTKTGKVKYIDERGNFVDSWLSDNINDYATKTKLSERNLILHRARPAYPGEGTMINLLKYVVGYRKDTKATIVNIDDNEGFSVRDIYRGEDELFNELNDKLKNREAKVGIMLGLNEAGYSIVYPNQFEYASVLDKDLTKLKGEKLEKARAAIEKTQENFKKIATRYESSVRSALKKAEENLNQDSLNSILAFHKETDFYYTDLLTEYNEDLRTSDLAIDYALIRNKVLSEFGFGKSEAPRATESAPF